MHWGSLCAMVLCASKNLPFILVFSYFCHSLHLSLCSKTDISNAHIHTTIVSFNLWQPAPWTKDWRILLQQLHRPHILLAATNSFNRLKRRHYCSPRQGYLPDTLSPYHEISNVQKWKVVIYDDNNNNNNKRFSARIQVNLGKPITRSSSTIQHAPIYKANQPLPPRSVCSVVI